MPQHYKKKPTFEFQHVNKTVNYNLIITINANDFP